MISVAGNVVIDACTLSNFAAVGRLDLLRIRYGTRIRWTETVKFEIGRGVSTDPSLNQVLGATWLGNPIEMRGSPQVLQRIDRIRRGLGATAADPPTLHLGEAEIIDYLETRERSWIFLSDDQPALDLARRRGLSVLDTPLVLADCFASGEVGCPEAYQILVKMDEAGRGVKVPPDHRYVC